MLASAGIGDVSAACGSCLAARWSSRLVKITRCSTRRSATRSLSTSAGIADLLWATLMLSISRTTISSRVANGARSATSSRRVRTGPVASRWSTSGVTSGPNAACAANRACTRRPTGSCRPCRCRGGTPARRRDAWTNRCRSAGRPGSRTPLIVSSSRTSPIATSRTWTTPWSAKIAGCLPGSARKPGSSHRTSSVAWASIGRQKRSSR